MKPQSRMELPEMIQNVHKLFTNDPLEFNAKHLKTCLFMALRSHLLSLEVTQSEAAKLLDISEPRMSNLSCGKLEKFSVGGLFELLVKAGYGFYIEQNQGEGEALLTIKVMFEQGHVRARSQR